MRAGNLRHVVAIQETVRAADGQGGYSETWSSVSSLSSVRADIRPLRSNEIAEYRRLEEDVTHEVTMYYRTKASSVAITTDDRIVFDSRNFDIQSIRNIDERRGMLKILALERI